MSKINKSTKSRPCVLLVDDDDDWRGVMRELLSSASEPFDVRDVANGTDAIDFLHQRGGFANAPRPDLIYLDLEMPGDSGTDVLDQIKSSPQFKDIPVVMLTGVSDDNQKHTAFAKGADAYLVKPSEPQQLVQAIEATLARWLSCLPKLAKPSMIAISARSTGDQQAEWRIAHPSILIVEDDLDQRALITEVLGIHFTQAPGQLIEAVGTGAEALGRDLSVFDVVLLDYNLPDMPGLVILEQILAQIDLPVIFVTGENDSNTAAEAIRKGAQDYVVKLGDYLFALPIVVEKNVRLHQIKKDNARLQDKLHHKNEQLEESLAKLRTMAATDHLTGLGNRRRFSELLDRYYSEAVRYQQPLACCMCDVDHFKELNDGLGHQMGDKVLQLTAEIICSSLRSSDVAARYGGDEFVLLLPHTDMDRAVAVGNRIRHELRMRSRNHPEIAQAVSLSIGVASLMADKPSSGDSLVTMADRALYHAKDNGKDRIVSFAQVLSSTGKAEAS